MGRVTKFMEKTNMKSVFCAGAGIQSILFFLNDGYLSATLACGSGVSPRTVRWGGTLLPQAVGRAMEWPATATTAASGGNRKLLLGQRPAGCECCSMHEASAGCRNPYSCPRRKLPAHRQGWQTGSRHSEKTVCSGCRHLRKIRFSCWFFP